MPAPRIWLQTIGSGYVDLENPKASQIDWHAMAIALSRVPRWNAHTERAKLSVAQHQEQGARAILRELPGRYDVAAAFVLHDAHEYVIGDLATPVALAIGSHAVKVSGNPYAAQLVKDAISWLKGKLDGAIYEAAGIPFPLDPDVRELVKEYDDRMLATEHHACMAPSPFPNWTHDRFRFPPLQDVDCHPWPEDLAASLYKAACHELLPVFGAVIPEYRNQAASRC